LLLRCGWWPSSTNSTWDDGDSAGMGVGYGRLPVEDLVDLLTDVRTRLRG
jgi:hypothetical protein